MIALKLKEAVSIPIVGMGGVSCAEDVLELMLAGATAVGIAIGFSRIGTIAATYGTPLALDAWGVGPVMLVAAGLVLLGLVLSYFLAPETRGKSLAETSGIDDR